VLDNEQSLIETYIENNARVVADSNA